MSERDIFIAALERQSPAERQAYLGQACGDDAALRRRVELLLEVQERAGNFLEAPAVGADAAGAGPTAGEKVGTLVGPYKLLEQIGEGGFGVVFMAEQQLPIRRRVALKVIKPGMDTRQVIARFEAERQALALMDHPNIAHVLDAGATASGRPYFVMELVRGVSITDYCDQENLTPRERLELFVSVCQAVQHAHHKGIIHRDLKPSNIMVTLHDGTPVVKVIDFGVAKALGQQLTEKTLFTNFAQLIGTPLYMSPEQAQMSALDADTRTDIYSLGVLLYELLTGTTPFDKERLRTAAFDEIRRIIREEEPPRPSKRISTLGATLTPVSAKRRTDPSRLGPLMRGDLDWIVMKALEKDRRRRYDSASSLAADILRYLHDEPVHARPPSAAYRFRKFSRRNKAAVAAAGGLLIVLAVLVGAIGWNLTDRASRRAAIEQEVVGALDEARRLLVQGKYHESLSAAKRAEGVLAGGGEPLRQQARDLRADAEMAIRLDEIRLGSAASDAARLFSAARADRDFAQAFRDFGIDVDGLELAQAAERIRMRAVAVELALALDDWAFARQRAGPEQDVSGPTPPGGWKRLLAAARAADPDPWRNRLRTAVEQQDHKLLTELAQPDEIANLPASSLNLLARSLRENGEIGLALGMLRAAQRRYPGDFWINHQLGIYLAWARPPQWDEASRYLTVAAALRPQNSVVWHNLGWVLLEKRKLDEALPAIREAIRLGPDSAYSWVVLGRVLRDKQQWGEAVAAFGEAIRLAPENARIYWMLAWTLANCPDLKFRDAGRAVQLAERTVELEPGDATYWTMLGMARYRAEDWNGAVAALKKSEGLRPTGDRIDWLFLAMAEWKLGNQEQARNWYARAVQGMTRTETQNETLRRFRSEAAELIRP